jgi:general secretion pathway protein D
VKRWAELAVLPVMAIPMLAITGCQKQQPVEPRPTLEPLPPLTRNAGISQQRVDGLVGTPTATPPAMISNALPDRPGAPPVGSITSLGEITLDFTDLDIRDATSQILGDILHVNYTVDPAVRGTATLHQVASMSRPQLVATLQSLLASNNATMVETAGLYRVLPAPGASGSLGAGSDANSAAVSLRYASAVELAKVLQPFVVNGGRVAANPGSNTLVVVGDPATRDALIGLIRAFDVDSLAGQSYALFPVTAGDAQDTASALQTAFRTQNGGTLAGVVRVVPMQTISSVLVIANQHAYIEDARRVFTLIEGVRRQTVRSWRVYYLQNSRSNDVANVLQQAFTPGHVTAQETPANLGSTAPGSGTSRLGGGGTGGGMGSGGGGSGMSGRSSMGGGGAGGGSGSPGGTNGSSGTGASPQGGDGQDQATLVAGNPLLGGLGGQSDSSDSSAQAYAMRIIPNNQNNAVLVYGTPQETETAEAMLRKIDVLPLQVQIEAVIAEVTLNDNLQIPRRQRHPQQRRTNRRQPGECRAVHTVSGPRRRRKRRRRCTVRDLGLAGGHAGQCPVVAAAYGHGQSSGAFAGRRARALPDPDGPKHAGFRCTDRQFDRLPRNRRHHRGHPARQQRRAGDAGHRARSQQRR